MHKCIVKLLLKWNLPTKVRTPTSSQQGHGGDGGEKKNIIRRIHFHLTLDLLL